MKGNTSHVLTLYYKRHSIFGAVASLLHALLLDPVPVTLYPYRIFLSIHDKFISSFYRFIIIISIIVFNLSQGLLDYWFTLSSTFGFISIHSHAIRTAYIQCCALFHVSMISQELSFITNSFSSKPNVFLDLRDLSIKSSCPTNCVLHRHLIHSSLLSSCIFYWTSPVSFQGLISTLQLVTLI
jgi:hypothetical protein